MTDPERTAESLASVLRALHSQLDRDDSDVYADLGGVVEVAEILGVPKRRVERWIERRDSTQCPFPVRELRMGNLYSIADWKGWYALWRVTRSADNWRVNQVPRPPR